MIYSLRGKLLFTDVQSVVVECGGVGYKAISSKKTLASLPAVGKEVFIYTYMNVKDDGVDLFGFIDTAEMNAFKLITSVNGVGPKIAIALLSDFSADELYLHIASNDSKSLTKATGVGIKLAQRIVLELKDKVTTVGAALDGATVTNISSMKASSSSEAVEALVSLGYSQTEATIAVSKIDSSISTEEIITLALKNMTFRI